MVLSICCLQHERAQQTNANNRIRAEKLLSVDVTRYDSSATGSFCSLFCFFFCDVNQISHHFRFRWLFLCVADERSAGSVHFHRSDNRFFDLFFSFRHNTEVSCRRRRHLCDAMTMWISSYMYSSLSLHRSSATLAEVALAQHNYDDTCELLAL